MHGNHIADPWDLPENPSTPGGVTTAPKPAKPGLFGRRPDDESPTSDADEPTPADEAASDDTEASIPSNGMIDVPADPEVADTTDAIEVAEEPADVSEPAPARFDLGLEASETAWEPTEETGAPITDFGLVSPSNDGPVEPAYEVEEPTLSDEFVATNAPGRPDHSTPQLRDPLTILALDDVPGDEPEPGASIVALDGEAPVQDVADPTVDDEPRGFRLPGLSLFARSRGVHEAPAETVEDDSPEDEAADPAPIPIDASAQAAEAVVADSPEGEAVEVDAVVPGTPGIAETPEDPSTAASAATETADDLVEPTPVVLPPSDPFADEAAEAGLDATVEPTVEPTHHDTADDAIAHDAAPAEADEASDDDAVEIELIEPDLSEYVDVETLYVTEEAPEEPARTALVTVDGVPGASVSRALDVVTAVASASSADDIAGAIDRAMEQLREKATELGGGAVIAVRSEVQEIGVGFLVIASGTAVGLT